MQDHDPCRHEYIFPDINMVTSPMREYIEKQASSWDKHCPLKFYGLDLDFPCILPVRHPYPRVCSMWAYDVKQKQKEGNPAQDFARYLDKIVNHPGYWEPWRPCSYWYEGLITEPDIIRHENLEEDLKKIGISMLDYDYDFNYTIGWDVEKALNFLTDTSIKLINERFAQDFEIFGYEKV